MLTSAPVTAAREIQDQVAREAESWERPAFAKGFPRDAELDALVRAFELGNYAFVRAEAPKLAARATDEKIAAAARELRKRLDPDPLAYALLALTTALLAFLTGWFLWHRY